jgi:hypothetical protein
MYQQEMFSNGQFKKARFIAGGCFGRVHDLGNGYVVKYADRDGTLNYLEWCYRLQQAGKGMVGMPTIDSIVLLEGDRYMVTMEHCGVTLADYCEFEGVFVERFNHEELSVAHGVDVSGAYRLACAFSGYMVDHFGAADGRYKGDLHGGNFMVKDDVVYLTDPSGAPYLVNQITNGWSLH